MRLKSGQLVKVNRIPSIACWLGTRTSHGSVGCQADPTLFVIVLESLSAVNWEFELDLVLLQMAPASTFVHMFLLHFPLEPKLFIWPLHSCKSRIHQALLLLSLDRHCIPSVIFLIKQVIGLTKISPGRRKRTQDQLYLILKSTRTKIRTPMDNYLIGDVKIF